jgi:hypothetical protein
LAKADDGAWTKVIIRNMMNQDLVGKRWCCISRDGERLQGNSVEVGEN